MNDPVKPRRLRLVGRNHPVLRCRADPVTAFDASLTDLAVAMLNTMQHHDGVGLAAPQVGVPMRLFVVRRDPPFGINYVFCNPVVVPAGKMHCSLPEGCLSLPDVTINVRRHWCVRITAQNLSGEPFRMDLEGLPARIVQHEADHLIGRLITDYAKDEAEAPR